MRTARLGTPPALPGRVVTHAAALGTCERCHLSGILPVISRAGKRRFQPLGRISVTFGSRGSASAPDRPGAGPAGEFSDQWAASGSSSRRRLATQFSTDVWMDGYWD